MSDGPGSYVDKRLDKLEEKLDTIQDALIKLAHAEEKLLGVESKLSLLNTRLNAHSEKIETMSDIAQNNAKSLGFISKIFWITLPILMGTIFFNLIGIN